MNTKKVYLTSEQSEFLDSLKKSHTFEQIIDTKLNNGELGRGSKSLSDLTLLELSIALIVGYSVKRTPKEKLKVFYDSIKNKEDAFNAGVKHGIEITLETLDIEVEGIYVFEDVNLE